MTDQFDPLWPHGHQTRDGLDARIYARDCGGEYPIHGAYRSADGHWEPAAWTDAGEGSHDSDDLINKPAPKRVGWINVYQTGTAGFVHASRTAADKASETFVRIACVRVEEGQFDD